MIIANIQNNLKVNPELNRQMSLQAFQHRKKVIPDALHKIGKIWQVFTWNPRKYQGCLGNWHVGIFGEYSPSLTTVQKVMLTVWSWLVPGINAQQNFNEDVLQTSSNHIIKYPPNEHSTWKILVGSPDFFLLGAFRIAPFQVLTFCWHLSSFSSTRSFSNSSLSWSSRNGLATKSVKTLGNDTFHQKYQNFDSP